MARGKKKPIKTGFKVYLGIIVCFLVILGAIFLNQKSSTQDAMIGKIDKFLGENKPKKPNLAHKKEANLTKENAIKTKEKNATKEAIKLPNLEKKPLENNTSKSENLDKNLTKISTSEQNLTNVANLTKQTKVAKKEPQISKTIAPKKVQNLTKKAIKTQKPKLVIIIDDVGNLQQARDILSVKMKITPSIFPPNKFHDNTPSIAKMFDFYMVHLPLQALKHANPEPDTLTTSHSKAQIEARVGYIVKKFGNLKYINNHTGSKFTSDFASTKRLLEVLKAHKIEFLDSLTTPNSKVKMASDELGLRYIKRDVFIDNTQEVDYTLGQIRLGVQIAKKDGWAVIIGHPYPSTIKALKIAKNGILKDVEIVYLKEIYELLNRTSK